MSSLNWKLWERLSRHGAAAILLGLGLSAGVAEADTSSGLPIHGFLDTYYGYTNEVNDPRGDSGFHLGTLDLYLNPQITDRIRSLAEMVVEFDDWYGNGQPSIDVERLQIGYQFTDGLTVWMGRFHTPYGWWNTAYHHGAEIQPTVLRPQFIAFEDHGGILPSHTDGLWANGHQNAGDLGRVTYDLFIGNGSRNLINDGIAGTPQYSGQLDMNNGGDDNWQTAVGFRAGYEFRGGALDTLWVGIHGLREEVVTYDPGVATGPISDSYNGGIAESMLQMVGGFAHWTPGNWEWMGEYYGFNNHAYVHPGVESPVGHTSSAWYAQGSYTWRGQYTPYARYEKTSFSQQDNYFYYMQGGQSYSRSLIGLRYDINPQTAVKIDGGHTNATTNGGQSYNEAHFQLAVRF